MLCQNCGENEANVRYTQIVNGVKKEMALCEKCSRELGIGNFNFNMPIDFSSFFGDFLNEYDTSKLIPELAAMKPLKCDVCHMTYNEFMNAGKFGCSHCYDVFAEKIDPILRRLHGNNRYVGRKIETEKKKTPKIEQPELKIKPKTEKEEKIMELQAKLKDLIKVENYEEAAKVRDEIKKLEGKN